MQRFSARTPPPPPPPPPASPAVVGEAPSPAASPPKVEPQKRGAFTVTEAGITWTCSRCQTDNPLDAPICSVCGTTFADSVRPPIDRPQRDPNTVALYSLFFPGAGHWYLGMKAAAVARGIVSAWVVSIALLAAIAKQIPMAIVFALVSFALWGLAAHDAYREAQGDPRMVILKGRVFVYLVMGLLGLVGLLLVLSALRVNQ
jgi:hypothetical protein